MKFICVCAPEQVLLSLKDENGNDIGTWPVTVYNVNNEPISTAGSKAEYIDIWNSDPANQARGTLSSGQCPFEFILTINTNNDVEVPELGGMPPPPDEGIYESNYEEAYE